MIFEFVENLEKNPMRILYIEDNHELRETIQALIENENRVVCSCASAEEAVQYDKRGKFDVVMTDISLPGMSGVDFVKALLASNPKRNIILCSGYDLGPYPKAWGENVFTLLKPFDIEDLEEMLGKIEKEMLKEDFI